MTNTWLCWAKISSPRDHLVLFWIQEIQLLCGMIFNWTVLHVGPYFLLDIMFDRKYFQKSHKKVLIMSHRNKASQYKWLFHLSDAKTFWKMYTLTQFSRKSYLCCGRYKKFRSTKVVNQMGAIQVSTWPIGVCKNQISNRVAQMDLGKAEQFSIHKNDLQTFKSFSGRYLHSFAISTHFSTSTILKTENSFNSRWWNWR